MTTTKLRNKGELKNKFYQHQSPFITKQWSKLIYVHRDSHAHWRDCNFTSCAVSDHTSTHLDIWFAIDDYDLSPGQPIAISKPANFKVLVSQWSPTAQVVILGTFLIVFVIPFYREYYQIIKKEQREQEKAYASKKRLMRATKALTQSQTRSCTKQGET